MSTISYALNGLNFQWDSEKAEAVMKKHGVSFQEAASVFSDEEGLMIPDPDHSEQEERFLLLGYSNHANALLVSHCYRNSEQIIRLISARKATKREVMMYHKSRFQ